jgi:hypothetical protein
VPRGLRHGQLVLTRRVPSKSPERPAWRCKPAASRHGGRTGAGSCQRSAGVGRAARRPASWRSTPSPARPPAASCCPCLRAEGSSSRWRRGATRLGGARQPRRAERRAAPSRPRGARRPSGTRRWSFAAGAARRRGPARRLAAAAARSALRGCTPPGTASGNPSPGRDLPSLLRTDEGAPTYAWKQKAIQQSVVCLLQQDGTASLAAPRMSIIQN